MPEVRSSAIARIEHDPLSLDLRVTFHGTGTYTYAGVPRAVYEALVAAPSIGRFFNEQIRDRYQANR